MIWTAKSLDDIAQIFDGRAKSADSNAKYARTKREQDLNKREALIWRQAAEFLREVKIDPTQEKSFEKPAQKGAQ